MVAGRLQETVLKAGAGIVAKRMAKTHPQQPAHATVVRTATITPTMHRITLTGPALAAYPVLGNDHYVRVLFPRPDQREPVLPPGDSWYPGLLKMDRGVRPRLRNYTLRAVRPELAEVDIDFVLHEDGGPASTWAAAAQPGDVLGLIEQGLLFAPDPAADHLLLVADDTGLPGVLGILESLPADATATVVVEVTTPADEQPLPAGHDVTWLHRGDPHAQPGLLLQAHLPTLPTAPGRGQGWIAGEASMITGIRRHLVKERGYDKADVSFHGYFKFGKAQYTD